MKWITTLASGALVLSTFSVSVATAETSNAQAKTSMVILSPMEQEEPLGEKDFVTANYSQLAASHLIGEYVYVYDVDAQEYVSAGDVNDLILAPNGTVKAAIIGVGGFLGIGEKNVGVDLRRLTWSYWDGENHLVMDTTKATLDKAPAFDLAKAAPQKRDGLQSMHISSVSAETLIGKSVSDANGEKVAEVKDIVLTPSGFVEAFVFEVGGILDLGEKNVLVYPDEVALYKDGSNATHVFTSLTGKQFEEAKEYSGYLTGSDS